MFSIDSRLFLKLVAKHIIAILIWSIASVSVIYVTVVAASLESLDVVTKERPSDIIVSIVDTLDNREINVDEYCSNNFCPNLDNTVALVSGLYERPYIVRFITFFYDDLIIHVYNKEFVITINLNHYRDMIFDLYIKLALGFIVLYVILHIIMLVDRHKRLVIIDRSNKSYMTNELQRDLTESLHHELSLPLAIIKTKINDAFMEMDRYIDRVNSNIVKDGNRSIDSLYNLSHNELPKTMNTIKNYIDTSMESINSTLEIIASKRKLTSNSEKNSFLDVLSITLKMYKSFQVNKINYTIHDKDIFKKCYVNNGMSNGNIINILTIMLNNSVEAKATHLDFTGCVSKDKKFLQFKFKDNGTGVKKGNNEVGINNKIFVFGYSSKVNHNDNNSFLKKIISFLDPSCIDKDLTSRGAGLAITKKTLMQYGGDIKLVDTSINGTTFMITLPICIDKDK